MGRDLHLDLSSRAADVAAARRGVARFAAEAGLDQLEIGAVELAVAEACSNVARHAYGDQAGPMIVDATAGRSGLVVTVVDRGVGIGGPQPATESRLGTSIMTELCDAIDVGPAPGPGGTKVVLTFAF